MAPHVFKKVRSVDRKNKIDTTTHKNSASIDRLSERKKELLKRIVSNKHRTIESSARQREKKKSSRWNINGNSKGNRWKKGSISLKKPTFDD